MTVVWPLVTQTFPIRDSGYLVPIRPRHTSLGAGRCLAPAHLVTHVPSPLALPIQTEQVAGRYLIKRSPSHV